MSSDEMDSQYVNPSTPPHLLEDYENGKEALLPEKSKNMYVKTYNHFTQWQEKNKTSSLSVHVLLPYFREMAKDRAPSTLWSEFSKLKAMLKIKHKVDIGKYNDLVAFLKQRLKGYQPKKSSVLTSLQVEYFLKEASDDEHLATKVAAIFGILGACRREELCNIKVHEIVKYYADEDKKKENPMIMVHIPFTKNGQARSFNVQGECFSIHQKYAALRPQNVGHNRFFVNYQNGKCTKQPIGINKFGSMPKLIATYLGLPNPEMYTGHCFRRTSATLFVQGGGDLETLKRLGGWKSNAVAEGYVVQSRVEKEKISRKITNVINLGASTSKQSPSKNIADSTDEKSNTEVDVEIKENVIPIKMPRTGGFNLNFSECANCTFNFNEKEKP